MGNFYWKWGGTQEWEDEVFCNDEVWGIFEVSLHGWLD